MIYLKSQLPSNRPESYQWRVWTPIWVELSQRAVKEACTTEGADLRTPEQLRARDSCSTMTSEGRQDGWSQSVVPGPAVISGCGPRASSGLRVWSPGQERSQSVVLIPATVGSPGSLSKMQIFCPAPIYCLRNSGICVLTNS